MDEKTLTPEMVAARAGEMCFGKPLVTNIHRGLVAEVIVGFALGESWRWCGADYGACDFEHADGTRLEVKQSAARQSWSDGARGPSKASFDIAPRTGRWEGSDWIAEPGRWAHLYVFAHHPLDDLSADHRDPAQWRFYIVATNALPAFRRLSLARATDLSPDCGFSDLRRAVEELRAMRAAPPAG